MTQIFTAKTIEDAKGLAARTFGVEQSKITFEVLEEPKEKLFGFIKSGDAKIRATYIEEIIVPEESVAEPDNSTTVERTVEIVSEKAVAEPDNSTTVEETVEIVSEKAVAEPDISTTVERTVETITDNSKKEREKHAPMQLDDDLISGEPSEAALAKIERAKVYLTSILEAMGVTAQLEVNAGSESALINISAGNNGAVIGKRGETLDALQYLTFMIANRGDKEYYRIILNSANYRERRRKILEELAAKIARNVLRSGKQTTLEPMNPYERRIIHSAISEINGVTSRSIGEEPYRRVIISSENAKSFKSGKHRNHYHDKNEHKNYRRRNHDNHYQKRDVDVPPTRISMDSMKTSFEKDYKRPKPEDDLNAGLYGKIEF